MQNLLPGAWICTIAVNGWLFAVTVNLVFHRRAGAEEAVGQHNWPEFHGPGRTNMSPETGLLKKWPEGGPPLVWRYSDCGVGYSGVAIAEGKIFTAGDFDDVEMLLALDLDGNLLWKAPNGRAWRGSSPGSRATPTYNEGRLYHMNPHGRLAAYEARTGKELWAVDLKAAFDGRAGIWAYAENVVVDGDRVLCVPGGTKGRVVALDKRTGKTLWVNTELADTAAYCSPTVVTYRGVRQLLAMTQRTVFGVDVETGRLVWSAPFVPRSPQNALTPLFRDGYVFVACGHSSGGSLFRIDPDNRNATVVWHRQDLDNCHSGTLLIGEKLFGCACRQGGRHFYCVDYLTGQTIKLDRSLGKVGITYADGMIYCLNHQGTMSLLAVTADGFEIISQFHLERKPANSYLAHPVVCGGRLYLRCDEDLFVYDIADKSQQRQPASSHMEPAGLPTKPAGQGLQIAGQ
jgi:outer membrane protein assembly factor BamB